VQIGGLIATGSVALVKRDEWRFNLQSFRLLNMNEVLIRPWSGSMVVQFPAFPSLRAAQL